MKSDFLDKLLLILFITILPISIFFASKFQETENIKLQKQIEKEQMAKVDKVVKEIEKKTGSVVSQPIPIEITKVTYATESGKFVVSGVAPGKNLNIMISSVISPIVTPKPEKGASKSATSGVLGQEVEVIAVKTDNNGNFIFNKVVFPENGELLEIRFDQDRSSATIQYNLVENKRTL